RLLQNPGTAAIPVVYMSGYGAELQASGQNSNVIGFLNKPFTSDLLTRTVETHMPGKQDDPQPSQPEHQPSELFSEETRAVEAEIPFEEQPVYREVSEVDLEIPQTPETPQPAEAPWWTPAPSPLPAQETAAPAAFEPAAEQQPVPDESLAAFEPAAEQQPVPDESLTSGVFFCGDTRFFSLNRALQII